MAFRTFGEQIAEIGLREIAEHRPLNADEVQAVAFCAQNLLHWCQSATGPLPRTARQALESMKQRAYDFWSEESLKGNYAFHPNVFWSWIDAELAVEGAAAGPFDVERLRETEGCLLRECDHDYTADCVDEFRGRLQPPDPPTWFPGKAHVLPKPKEPRPEGVPQPPAPLHLPKEG